jgi:hypothetical protein
MNHSKFEWSPEAIDAAGCVHADWEGLDWQDSIREQVTAMLHAAVKAQPVAAIPPCPKCDGSGTYFMDRATLSGLADCPACGGTGRVVMVPLHEVVEFLRPSPWVENGAYYAATTERHFAPKDGER